MPTSTILLSEATKPSPPDDMNAAKELWTFLDRLAQENPQEYRRYLAEQVSQVQMPVQAVLYAGWTVKCQQLQSMSMVSSCTTAAAPPTVPSRTAPPSHIPTTTSSLAKIRNHYINVCKSLRVEEPDRALLHSETGWKQMTIPMVLDDPRIRQQEDGREYCVYDMIVHPSVAAKCQADPEKFQADLVRCMMDSVQASFPDVVQLKKQFKLVHKYKGILQWQEHGPGKRANLPARDDFRAEKELRSAEEIQQVLRLRGAHEDSNDSPVVVSETARDSEHSAGPGVTVIHARKQVPHYRWTAQTPLGCQLQIYLEQEADCLDLKDLHLSVAGERTILMETPQYHLCMDFDKAVVAGLAATAYFLRSHRVLVWDSSVSSLAPHNKG